MGDILSGKGNGTFPGPQKPRHRVERRRLAGTVGPDQSHHFSLVYLKADALESLDHAIKDLNILYFQQCHFGCPPILPDMP